MQCNTLIVGGGYHPGALPRTSKLKKDEQVLLMREPSNPYDKHAVAVVSTDGVKLGYVPRQEAPVVAKAIDTGLHPRATCRRAATTSITIEWEN